MSDQYTPTTVDVKVAYRLDGLGLMMSPDSRPYDPQETAEVDAEFDRWLATVKAEAWEQGKRAEETAWIHVLDGHPVEEGDMCDQCPTDNPYREQETP